jgi:UDP-N-acetyl-D-mannosaminuronic acid dehydrogenase
MSAESSVLDRIRLRKASLAVLGLGHVGLPTALIFARAGFNVIGIDLDLRKVDALRQGKCYIREPGLQEILTACLQNGTFQVTSNASDPVRASDFVSICVPTPVENTVPDLRNFEAAFSAVKAGAHKGTVILIESTLPPSTTSEFVARELQHLGYNIDDDIFLAYCPERLAPVQALKEFVDNTRIIGGIGPKSSEIAAEFFKTVCRDVVVTDALTAELAKVAENTFRDLNIAYANLLALIAERLGADVNEVIRLANTHPRVAIHRPGLGVGGPCLPKDPYMLIQGAPEDFGQLVKLGRKLNDHMTRRVVSLLAQTLMSKGVEIEGAKVTILGVAYKADTEDVTNSPAKPIIEELMKMGASVLAYDPHSSEMYGAERASSAEEALRDRDCIIIVTAHTDFKSIDPRLIRQLAKPRCVIFDGPRLLDPMRVRRLGLTYLGTGYGGGKRPFQE